MKYLILTAGYNSILREEFGEEFDYLSLPTDLIRGLKKWQEDYLPIIQLDSSERLRISSVILKLDEQGIEFAKRVKSQLGEAKIKYFSEGLLKYIEY